MIAPNICSIYLVTDNLQEQKVKSVFHLDLAPLGSVISALVITITISLTACSKVEDFVRPKDPPPLEGKRIPVLTHNRSLTADKNLNSRE